MKCGRGAQHGPSWVVAALWSLLLVAAVVPLEAARGGGGDITVHGLGEATLGDAAHAQQKLDALRERVVAVRAVPSSFFALCLPQRPSRCVLTLPRVCVRGLTDEDGGG